MRWPRRIILLGLGVALGIAALVFGTLNPQPVHIDLYFGDPITAPLWAVAAGSLVIGSTVPLLLGVGAWLSRRRERHQLRRRVAALEREVLVLRNIPLDTLEPDQPPPVERNMVASSGRVPRQVFVSPAPPSPSLLGEPRRPLLTAGSDDDDDDAEAPPHR